MRLEKAIFFIAISFMVIVLFISIIRTSNGHPESECGKPRSHFLSTPKIVVPSKEDKIKEFQKKHGLNPDGLVGKMTCEACIKEFVE